jgi:ATP-binding protein involved in chromosome partitioning
MTRNIRTYAQVEKDTRSGILEQVVDQRERLARRLERVGTIIAVASGKGGVGKSAVTANLATTLASHGLRIGAVDADLNGPSHGRMLGAGDARLGDTADGVLPPTGAGGVKVISMEMLQDASDAPLHWRGPEGDSFLWRGAAEAGVLREFLSDVAWGDLDALLIDVPPGTDRIARLLELIRPHIALLVTTPAEMARVVVARSARLLQEAGLERVGIVANMTAFIAADGTTHSLYSSDGAGMLARETGLPIWAEIPFDPRLATLTDGGTPISIADTTSQAAKAFDALAGQLGVTKRAEEARA